MKYQKPFKIHDDPKKIYLRMKIIEKYKEGMNLTQISKTEDCTLKTVKKWVDKYKAFISDNKDMSQNDIDKSFDVSSSIRKRKISIPFNVQKYIIKKCSNKSTGGKDGISLNYLLSQLNNSKKLRNRLKFRKKLSKTTLHRFIRAKFGKPYKLRKKPLLKEDHKIQRNKFCQYINEKKIKSSEIFFTDEKIFYLDFMPNKQTNQIRLTNQTKKDIRRGKLDDKILSIEMPKKSKGFMVAGGVSKYGVRKLIFCIGTVDTYAYKQAIEFYKEDINELSPNDNKLFFQQDNAPAHCSKETKNLLKEMKTLKFWPPNSPEISPIEKVWSFVLRKLEGKNIKDLNQLKKEVLYIWNRIPKSFCEQIVQKFDSDIKKLSNSKGGSIKYDSKSSYGPYNLSESKYNDIIENIIYNKKVMEMNIKKKKKDTEKLLGKKRKAVKKIETKAFTKFVIAEISEKTKWPSLIHIVLNEEISPYKNEIESLEKEKLNLDLSIEECFKNLKQKDKEQMINITANASKEEETDVESAFNDDDREIEKVLEKIERPLKREKEKIREMIKTLIKAKIETKKRFKRIHKD